MSRLRGATWTADARRFGGKRVSGFPSKVTADRYEAEAAVAHEQGLTPPAADRKTGAALAQTWLDSTARAAEAYWRGSSSLDQNMAACKGFAIACLAQGSATPVKAVNDSHLMTWAAGMEVRGLSPATINRKLSAVSTVLEFAYKAREIPRKPVIPWRKVEGARIYTLTGEQVAYFCDAGNWETIYEADFCEFLLETGMRRGEATRFLRYDIVQDGRAILLPGRITKSGKSRLVPLTARASAALARWSDGPRFGNIDKDRFTAEFKRIKAASPWNDEGHKDLTPHALRHTCATWLIREGVNPVVVQLWMGHATLEQTLAYVHLDAGDLLKAASAMNR